MRVAILGWHPLYDNRIIGGPEAVTVHLAQGLLRQGDVDVHVVIYSKSLPNDTVVEREGLTVHAVRLRPVPRWSMLRATVRVIRRVVDAIAPDVVHAHGSGLFADAALSSRRPALLTLHGVIWREAEVARQQGLGWRDRLTWAYDRWYERWYLRRARDVIAISPYVEETYRNLTSARLHLIENPVGDAYFNLPPAQEGTAGVLCAARVMPRKNTLTLIEAFDLVRHDVPHARLRIAGEMDSYPAYAEQCRQLVRERGLDGHVDFLGWLDEPSIQAEYSRCACLALVSWQETAPIAIEQAMAAGRAVLASDVGGVRYMLADGQAGQLAQPDDVAGIARGLRRLLTDDAVRRQLGERAREEALCRFEVNAVAAQTRALYERVIRDQR